MSVEGTHIRSCSINIFSIEILLMVQKSGEFKPPGIYIKTLVNHGISTTNLPQLVSFCSDFWLEPQQY